MDFSIPPETRDLVARIRDFVETEVYPLEESWQKVAFRELIPQLELQKSIADLIPPLLSRIKCKNCKEG